MGCREYKKKKKGPIIGKLLNSKRTCNHIEEDINNGKPGRHCVAYCDGWSVILDLNSKRDCFLWNSVSGSRIDFPPLKADYPSFSKCILTSPPTKRECTICFFCDDVSYTVFCQIGDMLWTKYPYKFQIGVGGPFYRICMPSAIMFNRKLYGICDFGTLFGITFESKRMTFWPSEAMSHFSTARKQTLVDSCGDLFLVRMFSVSKLEVYKVNFSKEKWEKVDNLGDDHRSFFICSDHSVSFQAKQAGIKENSVCFTEDNDQSLYVFNLDDGSLSLTRNAPSSGSLHFSYDGLMPVLRLPDGKEIDDREFVEEGALIQDKGNEGEEGDDVDGQNCIWSKLPMDLQKSVIGCLSIGRDYMNFRGVCRRWRSLAPRCHWSPTSSSNSSFIKHPWLMSFQKRENFKLCNFCDPKDSFTYHMNCAEAISSSVIRFSKDSWLILSEGAQSMFFYEPFKKVRIELPDLLEDYCLDAICFSASPTSSNFIVCGIAHACEKSVKIFYFDPSLETWTRLELPNNLPFLPSLNSPIFLNGIFYFLGQDGKLGTFWMTRTGFYWRILDKPQQLHFPSIACQNFLVPFEEEFLSVFVGNLGKWVKVFKLDHLGSDWKEIKSLGNLMLFVSQTTSIAIVAKEERMKNKVYFPTFNNNGEIMFYCLETRKLQTFGSENCNSDLYDTKEMVNSAWVESRLVPTFC